MNALKADAYYICRMDAKGRAVVVHTRKTWRGIMRLANRPEYGPASPFFMVSAYVVIDEKADDVGTVYFSDLDGNPIEMA